MRSISELVISDFRLLAQNTENRAKTETDVSHLLLTNSRSLLDATLIPSKLQIYKLQYWQIIEFATQTIEVETVS